MLQNPQLHYLDNAATTIVAPEVADVIDKAMREHWANPSSLYGPGARSEEALNAARAAVARTLGCKSRELYFTSCGSESNNLALLGAVQTRTFGKGIVVSGFEHPSVQRPLERLAKLGYDVTVVAPRADGTLDIAAMLERVDKNTILVACMMVNNEIGAVEPVEEAAKVIKAKNPDTLFHVDAIQAYGKFRICPKKMGIDLLSVSGHKIHAPKGTGFLYIRDKVKVKPIIYGGGQQKGMRSGTENVPGVAALGEAAAEIYENFDAKVDHMYEIRQRFIDGVTQIPGVTVNGRTGRDSAPQIVSVTIEDVRSEVMLHSLEEYGIYVSAGSACSSNKPAPSRTLQGIGLPKQKLESTIRISFCVNTTEEEVDYAVEKMKEIIPFRRKFTRK